MGKSRSLSFKTLYTNGDSWTAGHFIQPKLEKEGIRDCNNPANKKYRLKYAWPAYAASRIGCNVINNAHPGASNDHIVRSTINDIEELLLTTPAKDLYVLVGFSSPERKDFYYKNKEVHGWDTYYPVEYRHWTDKTDSFRQDMYKSYVTRYWNKEEYFTRHILNLITLSNYLRSKRVKYKFFDAFYESKAVALEAKPAIYKNPILKDSINRWFDEEETGTLKHVGVNNMKDIYNKILKRDFLKYSFAEYLIDGLNLRDKMFKRSNYLVNHPTKLGHQEWGEYIANLYR